MSEWRELRFGDVATLSNGTNFTKESFGRGLKILGVRDFGDRIVPDWIAMDEVKATALGSDRQLLGEGDLVFVRSNGNPRLVGRSMLITAGPVATHSAFTIKARPNRELVEPRFLAYQLRHAHRIGLMGAANGTNITNLSQPILAGIPLLVPSLQTQLKILDVLGSVDDLIENNRRRVEVLEEMARALYREWFVKLRYPGHGNVPLVDSAQGPIPAGWTVRPLATVAQVNGSSRKPGTDDVIRYLDITALSEREIGELNSIAGPDAPGRARRVLTPGDTVWATVRPNRRAHALVVEPGEDWVASTGLAVLTPIAVSSAFLFEMTSTTAFSDWLVGRAQGSAYPAVRANDFEEAQVVIPEAPLEAAFSEKVTPMHALSWKLRFEASALTRLRDLLLPKLVTGQIDVSTLNLDALVEERVA